MEDNLYLKDIKVEIDGKETYLYTWDYVQLPNHDVRIYYKPSEDGFDFYAVERTSHKINEKTDKDPWHPYYCQVEYVVYGVSNFDSIRHLYFTSNNLGYTYYPNIELITDTLTTLKKMVDFSIEGKLDKLKTAVNKEKFDIEEFRKKAELGLYRVDFKIPKLNRY